jgi:hypothetical protein
MNSCEDLLATLVANGTRLDSEIAVVITITNTDYQYKFICFPLKMC